jgi:putative toxin-antitoxin system antitoxin component (TIGR02293 family)
MAEQVYVRNMSIIGEPVKTRSVPKSKLRPVSAAKRHGNLLGLIATGTTDLIQQIEAGFSFNTLLQLESQSGISLSLLTPVLGIPERTLARRRAAGTLSSEESERLLRVSSIFEKCLKLFEGDRSAAVTWLTTPKKAFNSQTPLSYSRTELGAREVENLIGRIEHGVFS